MDRRHLCQFLFFLPSLAFALPQSATDSSAPAFPTMSGQDGVGVPAGGAGSLSSGADGGASGSDNGAWSLGTGGIVGISVGIAVVVIGIAAMWWLWYMAKKRQWKIRESIKRASRRLTGRKVPPRTPRAAPTSSKSNRRTTMYVKPSGGSKAQAKEMDLEKGYGSKRSQKPSPGWLEGEKERSRSRSPEDDMKGVEPQKGGFMTKIGFGKR